MWLHQQAKHARSARPVAVENIVKNKDRNQTTMI